MRTLRKNKQSMKYALQIGEVPIYNRDENGEIIYEHYEDSDGNIIYYEDENGNKIPSVTGEYEIGYSEPVSFLSSLAMSGGEAEAQEFGLSISDYNATLLCQKGAYPIVEGSLIWTKSEVGYKDTNNEIVDRNTADYSVIKVSESLNFVKYVLKAVVK